MVILSLFILIMPILIGRILKAYVPYMNGYILGSVGRSYLYSYDHCDGCRPILYSKAVDVYMIDSVGEAACEEAAYKNYQTYDHMKECKDINWIEKSQKREGSILITPKFHSDYKGMFTPILKPGHSSAGA